MMVYFLWWFMGRWYSTTKVHRQDLIADRAGTGRGGAVFREENGKPPLRKNEALGKETRAWEDKLRRR